jgi:HD-GYP domain-containing protein (c-di-GMP phosphodiesterase class II)
MGVANTVWDKRGPLNAGETERVRLHPYYTDRVLASVPALACLAPVAAQHHERLDGSGYPRGSIAESLTLEGRVLAVADCYHAWSEPRPYREALDADAIAARLRDEVKAGRLDGAAVTPYFEPPATACDAAVSGRPASRHGRLRCCGILPAVCPLNRLRSVW